MNCRDNPAVETRRAENSVKPAVRRPASRRWRFPGFPSLPHVAPLALLGIPSACSGHTSFVRLDPDRVGVGLTTVVVLDDELVPTGHRWGHLELDSDAD